MSEAKVCVLNAPGINCNEETAFAFELAGGQPEQVHISELRSQNRNLDEFQILALPGGFSHGDDIAPGRILGLEQRTQLSDQVNDFVETGNLVIGICNGFQILTESGLLPNGRTGIDAPKTASLIDNKTAGFQCRWGRLVVEKSECVFASPEILGEHIELPSAHGEGQFLRRDEEAYDDLFDSGQVVFRYTDSAGKATEDFPDNPNGSPRGITGICDRSGKILGMMPHPERFVTPNQYVDYHRAKALGKTVTPHGLPLFKAMINYAKES